jgi:DnaJ-class molecular chaperone
MSKRKCDKCNGTGYDSTYDRELPPNPYLCSECMGEGKIDKTLTSWDEDER